MEKTNLTQALVVKRRPREYPRTKQQQKFVDAADFCGIKKGITKAELQEKMKNCIPLFFKEHQDD